MIYIIWLIDNGHLSEIVRKVILRVKDNFKLLQKI